MLIKKQLKILGAIALFVPLAVSCSSDTNPFTYIAAPFSENAVDLRSQASVLYDQGRFAEALTYAQRAFALDSSSEEGGIILSSIHMGLAGIDKFQLVKSMMQAETALQGGNAASSLAEIAELIGLSTDEYDGLTLEGNQKDGVEGAPTTGIFSTLPVLLPKTAVEARISGGDTIYHIAQAVEALCPFVADDVKILGEAGDLRHTAESCSPQGSQQYISESHFSWAFAHLAEAALFNEVVLYSTTGDEANLSARADLLSQSQGSLSLAEYIKSVNDLATVTDIIMPTEMEASQESMILAMFNNLEAASAGLSSLPGVPAEVKDQIVTSFADLLAERESLVTSEDDNLNSKALRDQMTADLAGKIQTQIIERANASPPSDEEKDEMCQAYSAVSAKPFDYCDN